MGEILEDMDQRLLMGILIFGIVYGPLVAIWYCRSELRSLAKRVRKLF